MLRTTVKISAVSNLSDARYCAGMGVEMLGFSMDSMSVEKFTEIRNWVAGVNIVGETQANSFEQITQLVAQFQPDYLQISHWQLAAEASTLGLPLILSLDFQDPNLPFILSETASYAQYVLIENSDDFAHLDTETLNRLNEIAHTNPILLGFGIKESNVEEVLQENIAGIALRGTDEIRPGFKDFEQLMDILEALEDNS